MHDWRLGTRCVHGGHRPRGGEEPVAPPLVRSSTFLADDEVYRARAEGRGGERLTYARETNPTARLVEARLAALDRAEAARVFSSGLAALHATFLALSSAGDRAVVGRSLYGGTTSLLWALAGRLGVELVPADFTDPASVRAAAGGRAALLLCEGLSNPDLAVADLPGVAAVAEELGARFVVDATFTSPVGQRPLEHGAHLVVHSASKYLGGHSDLVAGVVCGSAADAARVGEWRTLAGGCLDPGAAWLLDRGVRTLHLRVRAQSENALRIARWLEGRPEVARVAYPGLPSHPGHARGRALLDAFGGIVSFVHAGGDEAALALVRRLALVLEAPSLGGVETLVTLPGRMSHVHLPPAEREAAGVVPGLVRLAVGIEDADDLLADLGRAFGASG